MTRVVDGKKVESKLYPRAEYNKLTDNQKKAVRELNSERRRIGNPDKTNHQVSSVTVSKDDLGLFANRIIASMKETKKDNSQDDSRNGNSDDDDCNKKHKASSGGVGEFLANSKRKSK